jgi:predicted RNA methylase
MGFFNKKERGAVLIDIGSSSVGGAFMYEKQGEPPVLCYTIRQDVERRDDEEIGEATTRTLSNVCDMLVSEGAACLYREAGNAHIDMVLASVSAPWQETKVSTVSIHEEVPFVFSRALMQKAVSATPPSVDRVVSDTSVIATALNGYITEQPWGKRAERADLTVLTSTLDKAIMRGITTTLRKAFHAHRIEITAFAPVAYAVLSNLYPLQKEFVLIDVSGTATDALLVKNGIIAGVHSIPSGVHDLLVAARGAAKNTGNSIVIDPARNAGFGPKVAEAESVWLSGIKKMLTEFASEHPLPRSVFLLADEGTRDFLKRLLDTSTLRTLWLSDEPLSVIPLAPEHTASVVRARGLAEGDIFLSMLAIYYKERLAHQPK